MSDEQALVPYGIPSALRNYDAPAPQQLNIITIPDAELEIVRRDFTPQGKDKLTDEEFEMFITTCRRTGLHPALRQIHCAKFNGRMTIMMGIDGYRIIAQRAGGYAGSDQPLWLDDDGNKFTFWPKKKGNPAACEVTVLKLIGGQLVRTTRTANWDEFNKAASNAPNNQWKERPAHMLAIRAESHALRAAFPNELRGVELTDGMEYEQPPAPPQPQARMHVEIPAALNEPQVQPSLTPSQGSIPLTAHQKFLAEWKRQQLPEADMVKYAISLCANGLPPTSKPVEREEAFQKALVDLTSRSALREVAEANYKALGHPETKFWPEVNLALGIQDAKNRVLTGEQWAKVAQWAEDQRNAQRGGGELEMTAPEEKDPFRDS